MRQKHGDLMKLYHLGNCIFSDCGNFDFELQTWLIASVRGATRVGKIRKKILDLCKVGIVARNTFSGYSTAKSMRYAHLL